MTNCPNCGAPITASVCEYCGTVFHKTKDVIMIKQEIGLLASAIRQAELYEAAIKAMRSYSGFDI